MNRRERRAQKAIPMRVATGAGDPEPFPLDSLEDCLTRWTEKVRNIFMKTKHFSPSMVGVMPDGRTTCYMYESSEGHPDIFWAAARERLEKAGAVRFLRISEVWAAESDDPTIIPSKTEGRQEGLLVQVTEGNHGIGTLSDIERDWETGAVTLAPARHIEGRRHEAG